MNVKVLLKLSVRAILPYGVIASYKQSKDKKTDPHYTHRNNVAIYPYVPDGANTYIDLLKQSLKAAGYNDVDTPEEAEYVWLHWYENNIKPDNFSKKIDEIKKWQKNGRKVIFHIHNRRPHEHADPILANTFMSTVTRVVNHVSVISSETLDTLKDVWYYGDNFRAVSAVPHPNYSGVYGEMVGKPAVLSSDTLRILFFGLVRPYKGIEHLIDATKGLKNIEIGIYGRAPSDDYRAAIQELCKDRPDITLELRHIENDEIPAIFSQYHIVVAPYNLDSSLNSGVAILAFSYGRTFLGTNNGTLKDIDDNFFFSYGYKDDLDHTRQLKKTIQSVQKKYSGKYNDLLRLGDAAYRYVKAKNNNEVITTAIQNMFRRVR